MIDAQKKTLKYSGSSTSNLIKQLCTKHPIEYVDLKKKVAKAARIHFSSTHTDEAHFRERNTNLAWLILLRLDKSHFRERQRGKPKQPEVA